MFVFWSTFSRIQTEYGKILRISPHSVRMQENADQNNPEYGHFLRSTTYRLFSNEDTIYGELSSNTEI